MTAGSQNQSENQRKMNINGVQFPKAKKRVYQRVPDGFTLEPLQLSDIRRACSHLDILTLRDQPLRLQKLSPFLDTKKMNVHCAPNDGNSLFSCFSLILTGDLIYVGLIRSAICNAMQETQFFEKTQLRWKPCDSHNSANDYIEGEHIRDEFVPGEDLEVATFFFITGLDVIAKIGDTNVCLRYSSNFNGMQKQFFCNFKTVIGE